MYPDIPLLLAIAFVLGGFFLLSWSADKFIDGAAALARLAGLSPLLVGMVIIGFGTSAPELCVSALSGAGGHSDLSLGNAYGSAIFNVAFILGVAAMIRPLAVKPSVTFIAAPALVAISLFSCLLVGIGDGFTRLDGILELAVFFVLMPVYCYFDQKNKGSVPNSTPGSVPQNPGSVPNSAPGSVPKNSGSVPMGAEVRLPDYGERKSPYAAAFKALVMGLTVLVGSSHVLVWGCVDLAKTLGVSDLMIGLTIVAIGTSLPELASAIVSARRGENEFVLGNIIGSNFFNILAVVGLAGAISPFRHVSPYLLSRDLPVMVGVSILITLFGLNWRHPSQSGVIGRWKGLAWVLLMIVYFTIMVRQELGA